VADPGTLTGSIGVIFQTGQFDGLLKRFGVQFRTIKSGKFKDIGSATRPMLPEEERILQDMISQAYEQFLRAVAAGRRMPEEALRPLADGRVYLGEQALRLGLVDSIGGFSEALERAKKLAGIAGEAKLLEEWDLKEELFSELLKGASFLKGHLSPPSGLLYLWTAY
jgi:protease-4